MAKTAESLEKLKIKKKKSKKTAALPPDLFKDPDTGRVMQKKDDNGIWNQKYLELRRKGLA